MMIHIDHVVHKQEHVMMEHYHELIDIQVVMHDVDHHILTDLLVLRIIIHQLRVDHHVQRRHQHVVIEVGVQLLDIQVVVLRHVLVGHQHAEQYQIDEVVQHIIDVVLLK